MCWPPISSWQTTIPPLASCCCPSLSYLFVLLFITWAGGNNSTGDPSASLVYTPACLALWSTLANSPSLFTFNGLINDLSISDWKLISPPFCLSVPELNGAVSADIDFDLPPMEHFKFELIWCWWIKLYLWSRYIIAWRIFLRSIAFNFIILWFIVPRIWDCLRSKRYLFELSGSWESSVDPYLWAARRFSLAVYWPDDIFWKGLTWLPMALEVVEQPPYRGFSSCF